MNPKISLLASGLKLLSFQGVTVWNDEIIVATIESDLLRIGSDGKVDRWVNLSRYGIPTGMTRVNGTVLVALSAQETGHFLAQVTPSGKVSIVADLSELTGEFGAPFDVVADSGYYTHYWVAISTNVTGTGGLVARVTPAGKVTKFVQLPSSPFGIVMSPSGIVMTQENGDLLEIDLSGQSKAIANLIQAGLGFPLGVTWTRNQWIVTTNTGKLVQVDANGAVAVWVDFQELKFGLPTTIASTSDRCIVATSAGNLLAIELG